MPEDKIPPKWAAPFFIACAGIMALSLVFVFAFGESPPWYQIVVQVGMTVLCVWLARESSRRRNKEAEAPEPPPK
jgi:membrane protein implicated in regulation of membrane protease activity